MSINDYLSFINTTEFDGEWHDLGFGDEELSDLQSQLAANPEIGPVIVGAGGMRKMRFARKGAGKSGGVRVCYAVFPDGNVILLSTVFAKNEKSNLNAEEKKAAIKQIARYAKHFGV